MVAPLTSPTCKRKAPPFWEPESDDSKAHVRATQAQRPVPDEGAHVRPDLWPSRVVIANPDACLGSAILL